MAEAQLDAALLIILRTSLLLEWVILNPDSAQAWIALHLNPTDNQMEHILWHIYTGIDQANGQTKVGQEK